MIFLYLTIFLFIMHIIGKQFISIMHLKEYKHPILYGTILYVGIAYAIVLFLSVLHVSWNAFYMTISLYNILVLVSLVYLTVFSKKHKIKIKIKMSNISGVLKNNWLVYAVIAVFFFLYLCSENGIVYRMTGESFAGVDDYVYTMLAMKNIGVDHILTSRGGSSFDVFSTSSIWNGYLVELLHQDIFSVTRLFLAILSYILIFFGIDEVIFLFSKEKYRSTKYAILAMFLMYLPLGYASEISKFMFYPWFGNVQVTMLAIPMLFVILHHMRYRFSMAYYLMIAWSYFFGNSLGAIVYLTIITIIIMIAWYFTSDSKPNKIKLSRKFILFTVVSMCVLLLSVYAVVNVRRFGIPVNQVGTDLGFLTGQSELTYSLSILRNKSFGMMLGVGIFFYRVLKKESSKLENIIVGSFIAVFVISIAPFTAYISHNLLQFALRRFLESVSWIFIVYGFIQVYQNIKKNYFIKIVLINTVGCMVLSQIYPLYLNAQAKAFSINNIQYSRKVSPVAEEVRNYFESLGKETLVCNPAGLDKNDKSKVNETVEAEYIDYDIAVSSTHNAFIVKCNVENPKVEYLIVPAHSKSDFEKKANVTDSQIVKEIKGQDRDMSVIIYKVNGLPALG